jgi:ABC-type uncharacterized transport system permease subunit
MNGIEQALIGGVDGGTALLLPALGELIGQRAGIVNLGAEGCMLAGALSAFAVAVETGSAWTGVGAGLLAGAVCGLVHAGLTIWCRADQLASGLVVWFLALGVTSVYGTGYISAAISPLPAIAVPGLAGILWLGPICSTTIGWSTSAVRWSRSLPSSCTGPAGPGSAPAGTHPVRLANALEGLLS